MEDEFDLRKYIDALLRHWKLIVSITVIAGLVAGLFSFLSPSSYEAKASVLVTMARSEITLEPKYETSLKEDEASLRDALLDLVESSTVATQVIEQLGDELEPQEQRVESILDKVRAREQDNLIEILVRHTDPQKAAAIANAWAELYVSYVNSLYSSILQSPEELQVQADAARQEYLEAQRALEDFVSDNSINELSRQIADMELLCNVKLLREQIEAGASSSASTIANSLAFLLLQTKAFTDLPAEFLISQEQLSDPKLRTGAFLSLLAGLEVSLDQLSALNITLDDVDALISTLEARAAVTPGQSVSELRQEILELRGELEGENAEKRELENSRDIAWLAYKTVANKIVELKTAAMAQEALVQVADAAIVPESPVSPRWVMNIAIALVLGLFVGIFSAFGVEYFRRPKRSRRK